MKYKEIKTPNAWDDIYKIKFKFYDGSYKSKQCQNIITFDIETSNGWRQKDGSVVGFNHDKYLNDEDYRSMIEDGEPVSLLYVWQVGIEGEIPYVFIGRTWDSFISFMKLLTTEIRRQSVYGFECINRYTENNYALTVKHNVSLKIYVHNLGFEFQHLRNIWEKEFSGSGRGRKAHGGNVFARKARKPMKASISFNKTRIELRDTLVLTQKSLKAWCHDEKLPVQKLDEPKDYYLPIRTPDTPLTDEEIHYSINDVVSMLFGLVKYRDKYETLSNIPLTQTGAVRLKCRERVSKINTTWAEHCAILTKNYSPDDFKKLCQLFQGGWTHANKMYVGDILHDVKCFDFASSYPAVMTTRTFPIGAFEDVSIDEFSTLESQDINNPDYHWYAKIRIHNMISKLDNSYWSSSKVAYDEDNPLKHYITDNGRLFSAEELTCYMSDLDWDTFKQCYTFDSFEILELKRSESGYLPKELIETILEYFAYKTSLKGDPDYESLYNESKQFINAIFGCAVTKIIIDMITFAIDGWHTEECNDEIFYETVGNTKPENVFLAYQHGIWVTAWARHNLFDFIIAMDKRIAYCDTDSIKGLFNEDDLKFIEEYNNKIKTIEDKVAHIIGFSSDKYTPKTNKGKVKRLGIMEREDDCIEFKTLGAKRYVDLTTDGIQCTIAGLPKSAGINKIKSVSEFKSGMFWTTSESEKLIAHYADNQKPCTWTDRDGNKYKSKDKYGICLQPTTFDLTIGSEFQTFLDVLRTGKIDRNNEDLSDTPAYLFK